ncbi:MAG: HAMP domain-containing histidine kinase [Elusimicrobia bacterium]|nr:HAMP domain-containing histidine kinase [Elusimicrobiota bacterium]
MKLRTKLSISASLLVMIVITGVSIVLFFAEKWLLTKELEKAQINIAKGLEQISEESLITENEIILINYLNQMKEVEALVYAELLNQSGEILAHTDIELLGKIDREPATMKALRSETLLTQLYKNNRGTEIFEISLPLLIESKRTATVKVGFSKKVMDAAISKNISRTRNLILVIAAGALIAGIAGALVLAHMMTVPIGKMEKGAALIGQGHLDTRIDVKSSDELGNLAADLNRMAGKLKELDDMKQGFISSVTHELRSPITAIRGYVNLILEGSTGQITREQRECLNTVAANTLRLGRFIDDVLDLAKIEAGMIEIKKEKINIGSVCAETVQLLKPLALEKKLDLRVEVPAAAGEITADPDKMKQVITNLVNNSLKFTPEGGSVTVSACDFDPGSLSDQARRVFGLAPAAFSGLKMIKVEVKDTGIGIPEDSLKKVFSKFEQVSGAKEKVKGHKGTGLGLAIVEGIIAAHDGRIWVESVVDKGTSFIFVIPKESSGPEKTRMSIFRKDGSAETG